MVSYVGGAGRLILFGLPAVFWCANYDAHPGRKRLYLFKLGGNLRSGAASYSYGKLSDFMEHGSGPDLYALTSLFNDRVGGSFATPVLLYGLPEVINIF